MAKKYLMLSFFIWFISQATWAEPRIDYDIDDDGLIEINDLQDFNEIRNNTTEVKYSETYVANELLGKTLYASSDGCPLEGCSGYELTNDLDFDSNNNGEFDENDIFWNDGKGWSPIGHFGLKFKAEFNGNGHALNNLQMRRPGESFSGLFAYGEYAHIHNFILSARLTTGGESGAILGYGWKSTIENIHAEVVIKGEPGGEDCSVKCEPEIIGGIMGIADDSTLKHIIIKAHITGTDRLGGIAGDSIAGQFHELAVQATIMGEDLIGGLTSKLNNADVNSVVVFNDLSGGTRIGGLAGSSSGSQIKNILLTGVVTPGMNISRYARGGSLIASAQSDSIANVISLVRLPEDPDEVQFIGALLGSANMPDIKNTYWAKDLTLRGDLYSRAQAYGPSQNWEFSDLKCADETHECNGLQFDDFANELNTQAQSLWVFGGNTTAPSMMLAMGEFSDQDADGQGDNWPQIDLPDILNPPLANANGESSGGALYFLMLLVPLLFRRR